MVTNALKLWLHKNYPFPLYLPIYSQVKELIRNSHHLVRSPLRDTTQTAVATIKTTATPPAVVGKGNAPSIKGKGRKRSASENWLEHAPSSTVESDK